MTLLTPLVYSGLILTVIFIVDMMSAPIFMVISLLNTANVAEAIRTE